MALSEKRETQKGKSENLGKIIGYVLATVFFIVGCVTIAIGVNIGMVPGKILLLIGVGVTAFTVLFVALQTWKIPGMVAKVLSVILSILLIFGCYWANYTKAKIKNMSGIRTQIDNIQVYVKADDPANDVMDAKTYAFGILKELDRENTDAVVKDISDEVGVTIGTYECNDVYEMVDALYTGKVQAIILNSGYEGPLMETEGYQDFQSRVKSIAFKDIEKEIATEEKKEELIYGENTLTLYISGVDTRGSANVNSNSDVNIICVLNFKTHQILLIHTPRDFYVPLSISKGAKDKLTHAGGHGIDVSVETMELLYGVNIDDYVRVNFAGFVDIVDAMGGLDVNSEVAFSQDGFYYNEGINHLNGEEALYFARSRNFENGDRQRGRDQMIVIEAMVDKATTTDFLKNYGDVLDKVSNTLVTSMDYDEIADLVKSQMEKNVKWDVQRYSVDGFDSSGACWSSGSQVLYVMEPDQTKVDQAKKYLKQIYMDEVVKVD